MTENHAEVIQLANKYYDHLLTEGELARLNALLVDERSRQVFAELGGIHFCLQTSLLPSENAELAAKFSELNEAIVPVPSETVAPARPAGSGNPSRTARRRTAGWAIAAALAAALAALAATGRWKTPLAPAKQAESGAAIASADSEPPRRETHEFVARIVAVSRGLAWENDGSPRDVLMRLQPGERIRVAEGSLKVEFGAGAVLVVQGPADFEAIDGGAARLWSGSVTGRAAAGNFKVRTPQAEVVDIGTEFGVSVDRDRAALVTVFQGEVHVKASGASAPESGLHRLTTGMSLRLDSRGEVTSSAVEKKPAFPRDVESDNSGTLGANELSLVDVISGSAPNERRPAGAINPTTGKWDETPWSQALGVRRLPVGNRLVDVPWNSMIDGVFVPPAGLGSMKIDSLGHEVELQGYSGAAWGPVWARRRTASDAAPGAAVRDPNEAGFWGAGTTAALFERLLWARDGIVGLHANVGVTIDLDEVRRRHGRSIKKLRGVIAYLEASRGSQPFQPDSRADFYVYVDGQLRYERAKFSRTDGDAQFGALIGDRDRFVSLIVAEGGDGALFDRVILIDPVFEWLPQ